MLMGKLSAYLCDAEMLRDYGFSLNRRRIIRQLFSILNGAAAALYIMREACIYYKRNITKQPLNFCVRMKMMPSRAR